MRPERCPAEPVRVPPTLLRASPAGASSMVLQAMDSQGKGAEKLFSDKELREYAWKMYLTPLVLQHRACLLSR